MRRTRIIVIATFLKPNTSTVSHLSLHLFFTKRVVVLGCLSFVGQGVSPAVLCLVLFDCFSVPLLSFMCPPTFEEREPLTSNDGTTASLNTGFLVGFDLEASMLDTFQPPPVPLPYDMVLGGSASTDSESGQKTVSSFKTLITHEDIEESDCKAQANSAPISPRKEELSKPNETQVLVTEEEDVCPICLEEYGVENPRNLTKCEHHFHLSCILEWMERSDSCPICDQMMVAADSFAIRDALTKSLFWLAQSLGAYGFFLWFLFLYNVENEAYNVSANTRPISLAFGKRFERQLGIPIA
ncbi:hypothetical protein VNO77_20977 [Canavalia gladiata]|uniref:RING-type E3 ubiquitin transferase n=1 Tax=Canavalia gladiata TaxID=3824 RepID=A0AAN9LQ82_CANGL